MHTSTSPQSVLTPPPAEGTAVNAGTGWGALQRRRSSESFDDRPRPVMEWGQRDGANVAKSEPVTPLLHPAENRPSADTVGAALAGCALEPILSHAERAPQHAGSSVDATAPNMVIEHLRLSMEKLLETNARLVSTNAELVQRLKEEKRCRRPSKAAMTIQAIQVQAVEQDHSFGTGPNEETEEVVGKGLLDDDGPEVSMTKTSTRHRIADIDAAERAYRVDEKDGARCAATAQNPEAPCGSRYGHRDIGSQRGDAQASRKMARRRSTSRGAGDGSGAAPS